MFSNDLVFRLKSSETSVKKCYGFIDFVEPKSMMRAFGSKIFVKGKHVRVALSRFAMEVTSPVLLYLS